MSYGLLSALLLSSIVSSTTTTTIKKIPSNQTNFKLQFAKENEISKKSSISNLAKENVQYRLYIDSSWDVLTPTRNAVDFNYGKVERKKWYDVSLPLMVFNYSDFGIDNNNHEELIEALGRKITISYQYAFNMWDSKWGWRYDNPSNLAFSAEGKDVHLKNAQTTVLLKDQDFLEVVQEEKADTNTEQGRIQLQQVWNDVEGTFSISAIMGVWYTWQNLSIYDHAALTKFSYEGLDGSTSVKFGSETETIIETFSLSKEWNDFSLGEVFDSARGLYEKKRDNGWRDVLPVAFTYVANGYAKQGDKMAGLIVMLLNSPLIMLDIIKVCEYNYDWSGTLRIKNQDQGSFIQSDLYYQDHLKINHFLASTSIDSSFRSFVINLYGMWNLSYVYMPAASAFN